LAYFEREFFPPEFDLGFLRLPELYFLAGLPEPLFCPPLRAVFES
jgi:hypothetical protein